MFKGLTIAVLFTAALVASPADAQIMGGAMKDPHVCQSGRETGTWTVEGLQAAPGYNACSSNQNLIDAASGHQYKGIRVDPGRAEAPVFVYGNCFYIDNYTTQSFFVPANTPDEWASFVQNHPNMIDLVPCCQPDTAVQTDETCQAPLTRANHVRPGYREDHQVGTYGARAVALQCVLSANGRSAEWDLQADLSTDCDTDLADSSQTTGFRVATIQGTALVRNIQGD